MLLALAVPLITGCSPDGSPPPADLPISIDDETTAAQPQWTPGPLEEFIARIYGLPVQPPDETTAETQARMDQEGREREELVAACMAERGFDYFIAEHPGGIISAGAPLPDWMPEPNSREWAQQFGFGMSTDPFAGQEPANAFETQADPNGDQLAAMSDAERAAWFEALWGAMPLESDWDAATGATLSPSGGCWDFAQETLFPAPPSQFDSLLNEISLVFDQIFSDSRFIALHNDWSRCMATNGHSGYAQLDDLWQRINAEWSEVQRWDDANAIRDNWNWDDYPDGPEPADLPQPDTSAVASFRDWEISLAVADWDCRAETQFSQREQDIHHALQEEFVIQHRAELEAMALYMEEAGN